MKAYNEMARKRQAETDRQTREFLARGKTIDVVPITRHVIDVNGLRKRQWTGKDLTLEAYHREQ